MPMVKQLRRICLFAVKCANIVTNGCRGSHILVLIDSFDIQLILNFETEIILFWEKWILRVTK